METPRVLALRRLSRRVLSLIDVPVPRLEFLRRLIGDIREALACREVGLRLREGGTGRRYWADRRGFHAAARPSSPNGRALSLELPMSSGHEAVLELVFRDPSAWSGREHGFSESVAGMVGRALEYHRVNHALRERVKELTCLYAISQLAQDPGLSLEALLQRIADLLPPAWQYPEVCSGRIVLDGASYETGGFGRCREVQKAEIRVAGRPRGTVEAGYRAARPEHDEGPFLREERNLINGIAEHVALLVEWRQGQEERLREQFRHADRLATIGQLVAGVAHEINEPLGAILGFAQLARRCEGLPEQAGKDVDRIVQMSLHSREIVRKLVRFARQAPPNIAAIDLNQIVADGIELLEFRYAKERIRLVRSLAPRLPPIVADPVQLQQVFVNLAVNGVQAMPEGGTLTVRTSRRGRFVALTVQDTGVGMSEEVRRRIFMPFFTTKQPGQGTGLGLRVVQEIVQAHGGTIRIVSRPGRGSRFDVLLPSGGRR